jgi:hypothetical protein
VLKPDRAAAAGGRAQARSGRDGELRQRHRREGRRRRGEEAASWPWELLVAPGSRGERRGWKP